MEINMGRQDKLDNKHMHNKCPPARCFITRE